MTELKIFFIDNYDSFSYNLTDNLKTIGCKVAVYRNDVSLDILESGIKAALAEGSLPLIFLSPGPSHPKDANNLLKIIEVFLGRVPLMGVCLGHQALGLYLGGTVERCPEAVHGQSSLITHSGEACFKDLPNPLTVGRYHSLYVKTLPPRDDVKEIAAAGEINMALYSKSLNFISLQFHPESILTAYGPVILEKALAVLKDDYLSLKAK